MAGGPSSSTFSSSHQQGAESETEQLGHELATTWNAGTAGTAPPAIPRAFNSILLNVLVCHSYPPPPPCLLASFLILKLKKIICLGL